VYWLETPKRPHRQIPKKYYQSTTTMQPNCQQKADEISHSNETPTPHLKSTDQDTQTSQPYQTHG
jgi:hypothetical protein